MNLFQFVCFAALFAGPLCASALAGFVHPGVAHSQQSIDFVKAKIEAGEQPWARAWNELKQSSRASLRYQPKPFATVKRGPYNDPDIGSSEFSDDSKAAYVHALCWVLSGEKAHAEKAAQILDAWSGKLEMIGEHDARLLVGMHGHNYVIAAELLKHSEAGWPAAKQAQFAGMLRKIWYPLIEDFYPSANGNWDAAMLQVMIGMGVFLDDQAMFERAKNYYLEGKGNGAIGNYFKASGQCQESGRDQAHTQMGLGFLANTAETAWIQGVDLYGALDNRLLKGFEYTAKYNLGFDDVPYEPYRSFEGRYHYKKISDEARGGFQSIYEKVVNHYTKRKGLEAPFTLKAALKLRPREQAQREAEQREHEARERGDRADRGERDRDRRRGRRGRRYRSSYLDTLMYAEQPALVKAAKPAEAAKPAAVPAE